MIFCESTVKAEYFLSRCTNRQPRICPVPRRQNIRSVTYCYSEALILKAVKKEALSEELEAVFDEYGSDLNVPHLRTQLEILGSNIESGRAMDISDVKKHLQQMTSEVILVM